MPEGYPYQPQKDPQLNELFKRYCDRPTPKSGGKRWLRRWLRMYRETNNGEETAEQKLGEEQLRELWNPTFSYWQRMRCFWMSPVVVFLANAVVQVIFSLVFTIFVTNYFVEERSARSPIQVLEWVWLAYTLALSSEELVHMTLDGIQAYCTNIWNAMDACAVIFFWIAFCIRVSCQGTGSQCSPPAEDEQLTRFAAQMTSRGDLALQCYSVSVFCLWIRLLHILSADRRLGPLVLILRSMVGDTVR